MRIKILFPNRNHKYRRILEEDYSSCSFFNFIKLRLGVKYFQYELLNLILEEGKGKSKIRSSIEARKPIIITTN